MTILYTTHYMEEAQELSDHIAIMDRGEVIACGSHQELVEIVGELDRIDLTLNLPVVVDGETGALLEQWRATEGVQQVSLAVRSEHGRPSRVEPGREETAADPALGEEVITLLVDDSNLALPGIFESDVDARVRITSVEIQEPNLEAVFLHLTGRALRD